MDAENFLSLLQFSDGLFPVGSYAHSFGLESYVADRIIQDASGVESFLLAYLQGSVVPTDVVAMLASRTAALGEQTARMERCVRIDQELDAAKSARELRNASRQMGRQVLRISSNLGEPFALDGLMIKLFHAVENEQTPGHHPMAFGVAGTILGWAEEEMVLAYLYSTCSGLVAATLRLMPLGQLAGQRILWNTCLAIAKAAKEAARKNDMRDIWSFSPGAEIAAMRHEILDARLFRS